MVGRRGTLKCRRPPSRTALAKLVYFRRGYLALRLAFALPAFRVLRAAVPLRRLVLVFLVAMTGSFTLSRAIAGAADV